MMKGLLTLLFGVFNLFCTAQVIAVPLKHYDSVSNPASVQVQEEIVKKLSTQEGLHFYAYRLSDGELQFAPELSTDSIEKVADYLLKFEFNLHENYRPVLKSGENEKHFFEISQQAGGKAKLVDMQTGEVLNTLQFKKTNATDPSTLNTDGLRKLKVDIGKYSEDSKVDHEELEKIYKDYFKKIKGIHMSKRVGIDQRIYDRVHVELRPIYMPVVSVTIEKDKAREMIAICEYAPLQHEREYLGIFSLDTTNGHYDIVKYGDYWLEEVNGKSLLLSKTLGSNQKDVAIAHKEGVSLYASFSMGGYIGEVEEVGASRLGSISMDYDGWVGPSLEGKLIALNRLYVIDNSAEANTALFNEYYRQDKFIDSFKAPSPIGVDAMIVDGGDNWNITSVETGELLGSWNKIQGLKGFVDQAMEVYGQEVTIEKVTKRSKGKIKKFILRTPWIFNDQVTYSVYTVVDEKVGDNVIKRRREIGKCWSYNPKGSTAEFTVKSGEQEIYTALEAGTEIIFRNEEYKFLGKTYK